MILNGLMWHIPTTVGARPQSRPRLMQKEKYLGIPETTRRPLTRNAISIHNYRDRFDLMKPIGRSPIARAMKWRSLPPSINGAVGKNAHDPFLLGVL